jgi:hypothetical protein
MTWPNRFGRAMRSPHGEARQGALNLSDSLRYAGHSPSPHVRPSGRSLLFSRLHPSVFSHPGIFVAMFLCSPPVMKSPAHNEVAGLGCRTGRLPQQPCLNKCRC